jgi:hypothetical protein
VLSILFRKTGWKGIAAVAVVGHGGLGGVALHGGNPVIASLKVTVACVGVLVIVEIGKVPL